MKKTFKNLSLAVVAVLSFFIGIIGVNAENTRPQTAQTFTFDYSFKLRLGDLTKNNDGTYTVPVTGYKTTAFTEADLLDLTGSDEVHYKITEITEEEYNTLKAYQDEIDKLEKTADAVAGYDDQTLNIKEFQELVRAGKAANGDPWWCYNSYDVGEIKIEADCETKYYIVTVDALDTSTVEMANLNWNYHMARVYKVDANTDSATCKPAEDTTPEENPKTGVATPYVICGAVALVSIVAIVSNKKKKYI